MWLLPVLHRVSSAALHVFYRIESEGAPAPARGPVLLVSNHPNSLIDPGAVAAAAGRPVRFLAKAPLFDSPTVGWLVRAAGAIPIYRRVDDPGQMGRNDQTFRAAHASLLAGDAIGIFPEGLSHSEPALAPLRTGAARIALGGAELIGSDFPIVPIGLSFRDKTSFRSEALLARGRPVEWADLATAGATAEAVRELTTRIEAALREVTVNLESWEDAPLVEAAEEIYAAELIGGEASRAVGAGRVARLAQVGDTLRMLRAGGDTEWRALAVEIRRHDRVLRRLGLRPGQLPSPGAAEAARWLPRQLGWAALLAIPAAVGTVAYYLPYRMTGVAAARARPPHDVLATQKLLVGTVLHLAATIVLAAAIGVAAGPAAGMAALFVLPVCGLAALAFRDRARRAEGEAHRFLVRARRRDRIAQLRARQSEIAHRLEQVRQESAGSRTPA